jgi:NADH dehydrogenase
MSELVTVFGGTGFVGTYVVRALARKGWRIRVAARRPKLGYRLPSFGDVGQIQLAAADIGSREQVDAALAGASACVNLVGILAPSAGQSFQKVHAEGSRTVAEAAAAQGVRRFVQMSALGADPRSPSLYARTKAEAEAAVRKVVPSAVVLRPSVVFGPEDDFFNRFAGMATWSPALPLIGGGKTRFQPVYVGDVAQAAANALERDTAAGLTFELGGPRVYSFKELMEMVLHETNRQRALTPVPFGVAELLGLGGEISGLAVSSLFGVLGKRAAMAAPAPSLTVDQVRLLKRDNVVSPGAPGLEALGVTPTSVESIIPSYLWRYRKGGQFAEQPER